MEEYIEEDEVSEASFVNDLSIEGDTVQSEGNGTPEGTGDIMEDTLNALKKISSDMGLDADEAPVNDDGADEDNTDISEAGDGKAADRADEDNADISGAGDDKAAEDAKAAEEDKAAEEAKAAEVGHSIVVKVNGENIRLTGKESYIYVDVFEFIDFDLSKPQGHAVVTKLNDRNAIFNEQIQSGDVIEIYWAE